MLSLPISTALLPNYVSIHDTRVIRDGCIFSMDIFLQPLGNDAKWHPNMLEGLTCLEK